LLSDGGTSLAAAIKVTVKAPAMATNHQVQSNLNALPAGMLVVDMVAGKIGKLLTI
jgi:hypothetical protein